MKHILVTGASSGFGRAVALEYADAGTYLTLWGRDRQRLEETSKLCLQKGAEKGVVSQDIRDLAEARRELKSLMEERPVEAAFLASGVITGMTPQGKPESAEDACRTLEVNLLANANMGACLSALMGERKTGHIVFVSSIAGMYSLPNSPAYSASKIGVAWYARALAPEAKRNGVRISCVYPGYLKTPMGQRLKAFKPMNATPERMAEVMRERLDMGKDRIIYPYTQYLAVRLLDWLPKEMADSLAGRMGYVVEPDSESTAP